MMGFCKAPFVSQYRYPNGWIMMCSSDPEPENSSTTMKEEWNCENRRKVRADWLNGIVPDRCSACISMSQTGNNVPAFFDTAKITHEEIIALCDADGTMNAPPSIMTVGPSNKCQLACRVCHQNSSSGFEKMYCKPRDPVDNSDIVEYVIDCAPTLERYTFHGGEPFMTDGFDEIVEELLKYKDNLHVRIFTNGMNVNRYIEILNQFPSCELEISIDGSKEYNEYLRVGTNHNTVLANAKRIHWEVPHANIVIHHCISNVNINDIPAFYTMLSEEFSFVWYVYHGIIADPMYYAPYNLTDKMKQSTLEKLRAFDTSHLNYKLRDSYNHTVDEIARIFESAEFDKDNFLCFLSTDSKINNITKCEKMLVDMVKIEYK